MNSVVSYVSNDIAQKSDIFPFDEVSDIFPLDECSVCNGGVHA